MNLGEVLEGLFAQTSFTWANASWPTWACRSITRIAS